MAFTKTRYHVFRENGTYADYSFESLAESVLVSEDDPTRLNEKISDYDAHLASTSNPHGVTASQVGLGNVDNTSDADKPISTATQTALDGKSPKAGSSELTTFSEGTFGDAAAKTVINSITDSANLPTAAAVKTYVDEALASASHYMGTIDKLADLSTDATIGDYYRISTAFADGYHVGDIVMAEKTNPASVIDGENWTLLHNDVNENTTYEFAGGTNSFTVTPSGGSAQKVDIAINIDRVAGADNADNAASLGGTPAAAYATTAWVTGNGYLTTAGQAADSAKLGGTAASSFALASQIPSVEGLITSAATVANANGLGGAPAAAYATTAGVAAGFLGISAQAADSAKLGGLSASDYVTTAWINTKEYLTTAGTAADSNKLGGTAASEFALTADIPSITGLITTAATVANANKLGDVLAADYATTAFAASATNITGGSLAGGTFDFGSEG